MALSTVAELKAKPTEEHPLRALVTADTARAVFETPDEARQYLEHPGKLPLMASLYLAWADQKTQ
jgi:hypothetical protein